MSMLNLSFTNYNAEEFVWDGPTISCLNLCHGDLVSDVVYKLGKKVCDLVDDLNFEDLDLECLIDKCNDSYCLDDRSLKNLFILLNHNDCSLKELIDALVDSFNDKKVINLKLDLTCLKNCLDITPPKYQFLCADNGSVGDSISITYFTSEDPTHQTLTLLNKECKRFNYPSQTITIVSYTSLNPGSLIQPIVRLSIGFSNCSDCENYITEIFNINGECYKQQDISISNILQFLIYRLCCIEGILVDMDTRVSDMESLYSSIVNSWSVYTEPSITSCLSVNPLLHSLLTSRLANTLCDIRDSLGSSLDIQKTIAKSCEVSWISIDLPNVCFPSSPNRVVNNVIIGGINYPINVAVGVGDPISIVNALNNNLPVSLASFSFNQNLNQLVYINQSSSPILIFMTDCSGLSSIVINFVEFSSSVYNLAQNSENQWYLLCNLISRVKAKELSSCCIPSCKDLKINFAEVYIEDEGVYSLLFNKNYGNIIPAGWVDCGSKLTVTDSNNISYTYDIEFQQDFTYDLDLSGLNTGKPLTLNIKTCLSNGSLTCKECITKTLPAVQDACSLCRICAGGSVSTDQIKVTYTTADNDNIRSSILSSGMCLTFKVPEESPIITSIMILRAGSDIELYVDPSTQCSENIILPQPKINTCWFFPIPLSESFNINMKQWQNLSPFFKLDFDFSENLTNSFKFKTLKSDVGITNLSPTNTLDVELINANSSLPLGVPAGSMNPDEIIIKPSVPTYSLGAIASVTTCGQIVGTHSGDTNAPGRITVGITNAGSQQELTFDYYNENNLGLILELQGQDPSNIPELTITDPVTGTEMIIKGQLYDDCTCQ
jgi:hypothetical protein